MAIKPSKAIRKKPSRKVRDLVTRKDPKGGAQKKEGPAASAKTRAGSSHRAGKRNLA